MPVISSIVTIHAEEAAFLWILRTAAVHAPHYSLKDLAHIDDRVEAHLDGLRVAGDAGWDACVEQLGKGEPGEAFAAGVIALEGANINRLKQVIDAAIDNEEMIPGLISAFGWVEPGSLKGLVCDLLKSDSALDRHLGITACALHRADPGKALELAIRDENPIYRARALRAVGEIGRQDLRDKLLSPMVSEDPACFFWAIWSAIRLGERGEVLDKLRSAAIYNLRYQIPALQLFLRVVDGETANALLKELAGDKPWLIHQMEVPELARVAGEAFAMITGVDLAYQDLDGDWPEGFEAGPTDNPEDVDVDLDPDEDLPWPVPKLVQQWWDENQNGFESNERYLLGKPITAEHCRVVLNTGFQRQRIAAALELAVLNPQEPLFETRERGNQQQKKLNTIADKN
jgi:hypothetical protein